MKSAEMVKDQNLDYYYKLCIEKWWNCSSDFKFYNKEISYREKKIREKRFDNLVDDIINHICSYNNNEDIDNWNDGLIDRVNKLLENGYIFDIGFEEELKNNFFKITKEFIKEAKNFDENISINDICQALRNVWIISILRAIKGEKIELTKGIFSYSMLYPYTDNYLDDPEVSGSDKQRFNERLYKKLQGKDIVPYSEHEVKVHKLVENIESVFDRNKYKELYEGLIEIQRNQTMSLSQQDGIVIPYEKDILGITIKKGGSSVLVDGYLANGDLSREEIGFCIGYGMLLQLIDDLQDVKEDLSNNRMTIMSQLAGKYKLDGIVNKLLNFTCELVEDFKLLQDNEKLKRLIKDNCIMLILFSVVLSKEFFSKKYIKEEEQYLPFTMGYIGKLKKNLKKKINKINKMKDKEQKIKEIADILLSSDWKELNKKTIE